MKGVCCNTSSCRAPALQSQLCLDYDHVHIRISLCPQAWSCMQTALEVAPNEADGAPALNLSPSTAPAMASSFLQDIFQDIRAEHISHTSFSTPFTLHKSVHNPNVRISISIAARHHHDCLVICPCPDQRQVHCVDRMHLLRSYMVHACEIRSEWQYPTASAEP